MTETLLSIISIFIGIIGANAFAGIKKKYTLGFIGNTISGIFGSIFFIKIFGRLGIGPLAIMQTGELDIVLFSLNILVSLLGGVIGLIAIKLIKDRLNKSE